jgi:hypothetical protein
MAALPEDFPELPTLNAVQLGAFLGIGDERVRQLAKEGVIIKLARGQFDLRQSVLNYVNYAREAPKNQHGRGRSAEGPADLDDERAMLTRAKRLRAELELDVIQGRVHEGEAVRSLWVDQLMACRAKMLALPQKAAPIVAGMPPVEVQEQLTDLVHEALEELSEYNPRAITDRTDKRRLFGEVGPDDDASLGSASEADAVTMG